MPEKYSIRTSKAVKLLRSNPATSHHLHLSSEEPRHYRHHRNTDSHKRCNLPPIQSPLLKSLHPLHAISEDIVVPHQPHGCNLQFCEGGRRRGKRVHVAIRPALSWTPHSVIDDGIGGQRRPHVHRRSRWAGRERSGGSWELVFSDRDFVVTGGDIKGRRHLRSIG